MNQIFQNIKLIYPEVIMLIGAVLVLLCNLSDHKIMKKSGFKIAMASLIIALFWCMHVGEASKIIFSGLYLHNQYTQAIKFIICGVVLLHFIYSLNFIEKLDINIGDYCCLSLLATLGMLVLASSNSFLTVYLGLEVLSLPLYALIAIRRDSILGSEAAMKYFVMGSVASSILLYGMSLIYGVTGSLEFNHISHQISLTWSENQGMLTIGTVLLIVGLGFKLSQVPFHTWAPDVYEGSPHSIMLFLGTGPKVAVVGLMVLIFSGALVNMSYQWQQVMMVMAISSILIGNLFALLQKDFRRLLAYSAIAHMGYAVLGFVAVTASGFAAATFYIFVYVITTLAAIGLLVLTKTQFDSYDNLENLKGLNKTRPHMAAALTIILLSLAGIPPTAGFLSKFWILKTLMDSDHVYLTITALILAVIGAVYYIRIIKQMYFDNPIDRTDGIHKLEINFVQKLIYAGNIGLILFFGIIPSSIINFILKIMPYKK